MCFDYALESIVVVGRRGLLLTIVAALTLLGTVREAHAQAAPDRWREFYYYPVHATLAAGTLLLGFGLSEQNVSNSGPDPVCFPGDESVRNNVSSRADDASNVTVWSAVAVPLILEAFRGSHKSLTNFGVVYGETMGVNLLLNSFVKIGAARPRPCAYESCKGADDQYASFYSSHSSNAFAAATAGSLMLTEDVDSPVERATFWAIELGLATATANMRVKAGKHYYSDVLTGAVVGSVLGVAIPVLHGAKPYGFKHSLSREFSKSWGPDVLGMLTGLTVGILAAELTTFDGVASGPPSTAVALLSSLKVNTTGSDGAIVSLGGLF